MIILPTIVILGEILNLFGNLENYGINEHNRPDFDVRVRRHVNDDYKDTDTDVIETSYIINNLLHGFNRKEVKRDVDEKNEQEKELFPITYYGFNRSDVPKNPFYRSGDSTYYNPYSSTEYFTQNTPLPIPDNVEAILKTNQNVTSGDDKDNVEVTVKKRDTSHVNTIQTFKHKQFSAKVDEKPKFYSPYSTTRYYTQNTPLPLVANADNTRYSNTIREDMSKINTYRDRLSERYNKNVEIVKKIPVNANNDNQNGYRNDRLTNESHRNNRNHVFYYGFETTIGNSHFNPGNFAPNQSYGNNMNYPSTTNRIYTNNGDNVDQIVFGNHSNRYNNIINDTSKFGKEFNGNNMNYPSITNRIYANNGDNVDQIVYGNYSNIINDTSKFGKEFTGNTKFNETNAFKAPNGLNTTTPIVENSIIANVTEKIVQGYVLGFSACASGYRRVLMRCVPIGKYQ